jgi:hypothetical protein
MIPLAARGPAPLPAFFSNPNIFSLQKIHAKHRSLSALYPGKSDVAMCGSSKPTKPAYRIIQSVVLASLAFICISSAPSFTTAEGMDAVTGEILFQTRCYQCHAGKEPVS